MHARGCRVISQKTTSILACVSAAMVVLCAATLFGCASQRNVIHTEYLDTEAFDAAYIEEREYRVAVGDTLELKFFRNPELDSTVKVKPDGKVAFLLIGELSVVGMTSAELNKSVTDKYTPILKEPSVALNVVGFNDWKVYVGGEVVAPGLVPYSDAKTVLRAVFASGGVTETANLDTVLVVRKGPDNNMLARVVNLQEMLAGELVDTDIPIQPLDIVYVPKTHIAEANKFVAQYIKQMLPISIQSAFVYDITQ